MKYLLTTNDQNETLINFIKGLYQEEEIDISDVRIMDFIYMKPIYKVIFNYRNAEDKIVTKTIYITAKVSLTSLWDCQEVII